MINPKDTKAIIIGVSEFQDNSFINAAPIKNNVTKLYELLQNKKIIGLDKKNILLLNNNERHDEILNKIENFVEQDFTDTVIFYFAGHGFKNDADNKFYLVTNNARKKRMNMTAIPWDEIKNIFEKGNGIQQRFYILDACHSGAAALGENDEELILEDGSALIAAAKADSKAYFNQTDKYTYFSGALINILEKGIDNIEQEALSVNPLYENLEKRLKDKNFDITKKTTSKIDKVNFFKNVRFDTDIEKIREIEKKIAWATDLIVKKEYKRAERTLKSLLEEAQEIKRKTKIVNKIKQLESDITKYKTEKQKYKYPPKPIPKQATKTDNDIVWQDKTHGTFTDSRDGQKYKVVKINNQIWLAENFNYTQGIPHITDENKWKSLKDNNTDAAWCHYDNKPENGKKYGALYAYAAVLKVAPKGWHLPTKKEFETLLNNYGDKKQAYKALIKGGKSDLNVLFGGWRDSNGNFYDEFSETAFWSATEYGNSGVYAWNCDLGTGYKIAYMYDDNKSVGLSVRLLRD